MVDIKLLENGAKLVVENNGSSITCFGVLVGVGSVNESKEFEGVSHFVEHLMFKSTKKRSTIQIASDLEFLGTDLNAYTSKNHTLYYFKSLTENFEKSLEIYADMLQNGLLKKEEVDPERDVVIEEMKLQQDSSMRTLYSQTDKILFDGTTHAHGVLGSEDIIKNISVDKIKQYINKHYTPNNMIFSISGGVTVEQAEELLRKYFPNYFAKKAFPKKIDKTPYDIVVNDKYGVYQKEDNQVNIMVSIKGKSLLDKDKNVQSLYSHILGGGMSSRLFSILREKMGLAYTVNSFPYERINSGTLNIYIGTSKEKISKALVGMKKIMFDIAKNGVSELEFQRSKNKIKASIMFDSESSSSNMMDNAVSVWYTDKIKSKQQIIDEIDAVTIEDVNKFAKQIFLQKEFLVYAVGNNLNKEELKVFETCINKSKRYQNTKPLNLESKTMQKLQTLTAKTNSQISNTQQTATLEK